MEYVRLGKTDLLISRVAFGAMRLSEASSDEEAAKIVRTAYDAGINFFDVSHQTPTSEKLLGEALFDIKRNVFLSTATSAKTSAEIKTDLEESLMTLHCDTVDLYQLEVNKFLPLQGGADKIYETLQELKDQKKINHIGIVTTNFEVAVKAVESNQYETLQFPFSMVSAPNTIELVKLCEAHDVGFIAMQPLGGGLVDNIPLAFGFLSQYENVVPVWGVRTIDELNQILYFNSHPPVIDEKFIEEVNRVRMFFN